MEIGILGPLEVRIDGRAVGIAGSRLRTLVTRLALDAPAVVSTAELIDALWPQVPPADPITFNIYPDEAGSASTKLYEDDGLTPEYKNGAFRRTSLTARRSPGGLVVSIGAAEGTYNPGPRKFNFVFLGQSLKTVVDNGKAQEVQIR